MTGIEGHVKTLLDDFSQPVSSLIPAVFFSVCIVWGVHLIRKKKDGDGIEVGRRGMLTVFLAYLMVVFYMTFLCREPGSRNDISLVLFETWGEQFSSHAMFIENIILFIPFGMLLPLLYRRFRQGWICVLAGFLCSCSIEIMQHLTGTGYLQLDDIVTNTAGTLLGWLLWKAWGYYIEPR